MGVMAGFVSPDSGRVLLDGKPLPLGRPFECRKAGIAMVHQHFMLVPEFTVAENLALDRLGSLAGRLDVAALAARALELARELGWEASPAAKVRNLPVGIQQRIEILKVLADDSPVVILDEPTAVLGPDEVLDLFRVLRDLRDQGKIVILIAHKLSEVLAVADRVTVLRRGRFVATAGIGEVDEGRLATWMVGDLPPNLVKEIRQDTQPGLLLKDVWAKGDRGEDALRGISLEVRRGEILGIGGVDGNGQVELAEAAIGVRVVSKGKVAWLPFLPEGRGGRGRGMEGFELVEGGDTVGGGCIVPPSGREPVEGDGDSKGDLLPPTPSSKTNHLEEGELKPLPPQRLGWKGLGMEGFEVVGDTEPVEGDNLGDSKGDLLPPTPSSKTNHLEEGELKSLPPQRLGRKRLGMEGFEVVGASGSDTNLLRRSGDQRSMRIGYVPQDRQMDGLALGMSIQDNMLIEGHRWPELTKGPFLRVRAIRDWSSKLVEQFQIKTPSPAEKAGSLSGGNQQKVVVSRNLDQTPDLLVAVNPTRGLDIRAADFVQRQILKARDEGAAVLLISTDLDELASLADRTLFLSRGELREAEDAASLVGGTQA